MDKDKDKDIKDNELTLSLMFHMLNKLPFSAFLVEVLVNR